MKICKIKDCKDKVCAKGYCDKHYRRWRKYDDPNIVKIRHHGYSKYPLYRVWADIKTRCYNENATNYKYYGGRGITICADWKNDPKAFIEWALPLWKKGLLIDRIDNEGNYEPSNCRFVTYAESRLNQRLLTVKSISGYRGVSYHKKDKKWRARITINSKEKYLGNFSTPIKAALAYNNAVSDNRPKNMLT